MNTSDVAIIGAGPYGLSIAAHLAAADVNFRIFGKPMHTWAAEMPRGMRLKSDGLASSLYEPTSQFSLKAYCKEKGLSYADVGLPVPLETFVAYGLEFQKRFVPNVEDNGVVSLRREGGNYQIGLNDGEVFSARRVVVAVGLSYYQYLPPVFASLPDTYVTHSSKHKTLDRFKGRDVIVVGAGSSALDIAALLYQAGARARVVARAPMIRLYDPAPPPGLLKRMRAPLSGLGRGWKIYLCANAPLVFRLMPQEFRLDKVRKILGPSPAWFIKKDIDGKVPLCTGLSIQGARVENGRVKLDVTDKAGVAQTFEADHLIAGTGYKVDLRRLPFFDCEILEQIRSVENTPVLSSNFESSLTGLYFVGTSAANTFGPLLRFAVGAKFTARRLSRHLARSAVSVGLERRSESFEVKKFANGYTERLANQGK